MTGLRFAERMSGRVAFGTADHLEGSRRGEPLELDVEVDVADVRAFLDDPQHTAQLRGTVRCGALGGRVAVEQGSFNLFVDDARDRRAKRMRYVLRLADRDGRPFVLSGFKEVVDGPGLDVWSDTTTLFVTLHAGTTAAAPVTAAGIVRLSHAGVTRLVLSMRARGGTPLGRVRAKAAFGRHFLGELWEAYGGASRLDDGAMDPDADPFRGHEPGAWHDLPGQAGLERRILALTAGDGRPLTLHHVRGEGPVTGPPVLCLHGVGVRGDIFLGAPGGASLARSLTAAGREVFVLNWRGSLDLPPASYVLDDAALLDHPAAIAAVRGEAGGGPLDVVAHCQGSTSFTMTALAGRAGDVRHVLSSAVSLHTVAPWRTRVKSRVLLPVAALRLPYFDARWALGHPTAISGVLTRIARAVRARECDNVVCRMGNYLYGAGDDVLYVHDRLDPGTHEWMAGELGFAPVSFFRQMARCLAKGHLVPARRERPMPDDLRDADLPAGQRWTFLAGTRNRLYLPVGQERSFAHFDARDPGRHRLELLEGMGHLDPLLGADAARTAHPRIVEALR